MDHFKCVLQLFVYNSNFKNSWMQYTRYNQEYCGQNGAIITGGKEENIAESDLKMS